MKQFDRNDRNRGPSNNRKFSHGGHFQKQPAGRVQRNKFKHPQQQSSQQSQQRRKQQQPSRKLPPITPKKLCFQWQAPKHVGPGLTNGQNTCFLNSVLQCLSYTPALAQYLLTGDHQKECKDLCTVFGPEPCLTACHRPDPLETARLLCSLRHGTPREPSARLQQQTRFNPSFLFHRQPQRY